MLGRIFRWMCSEGKSGRSSTIDWRCFVKRYTRLMERTLWRKSNVYYFREGFCLWAGDPFATLCTLTGLRSGAFEKVVSGNAPWTAKVRTEHRISRLDTNLVFRNRYDGRRDEPLTFSSDRVTWSRKRGDKKERGADKEMPCKVFGCKQFTKRVTRERERIIKILCTILSNFFTTLAHSLAVQTDLILSSKLKNITRTRINILLVINDCYLMCATKGAIFRSCDPPRRKLSSVMFSFFLFCFFSFLSWPCTGWLAKPVNV